VGEAGVNSLTAQDICVIIEASSKHKVKSLAYGGLKIDFDTTRDDEKKNLLSSDGDQPEGGETPSGAGQRVETSTTPSSFMEAEDRAAILEEIRLAQLMTDDPMAYEQEMIDANLNPRVVNGSGKDGRGPESDL
jgi:hypothetical protein